jgi:hypothetical protein
MDERDILHHLLEVESEAASLATDAQVEADRRLAERERIARSAFDARFAKRAAELQQEFEREAESVVEEYRRELDAYRVVLENAPIDTSKFSKLVESLLFGEH